MNVEAHVLKHPEFLDLMSLKRLSVASGARRLAKLRIASPIRSRNAVITLVALDSRSNMALLSTELR
jgi:hypothetical protein